MRGFSLLELLAALAILAVLAGMALVYMPEFVAAKRSDAALRSLRVMINFARHAAIVRGHTVIVCPRQQQASGTGCGPRNTWHHGALVFADYDGNHRLDTNDEELGRSEPMVSGRVYWRAFRSRSYLVFTPRGFTDWQNGHLLYCPHEGQPRLARQLVLNVTGRTYPSRDSNGDGVHEDVRGRPLRCPIS